MAIENNQSKNDKAEAKKLEELKAQAIDLGLEVHPNIGVPTLEKKIAEATKEKESVKKAKPAVVTEEKVRELKARSLSKVRVTNLDKENSEATTVFVGVHNMHIDLARVVPLDMEIALEEALIQELQNRTMIVNKPQVDANGKKTGNTVAATAPAFAVTRL